MLARQAPPLVLRDVGPIGDAQQRIVCLVVVGLGEVDLVGRNDRQRAAVGKLEQRRLRLDLVLEAMTLDLDVEPVAENSLQRLQALEGDLVLALAQRFADRPVGSARQRDQALAVRFEALDLDVRCLILARIEKCAGGELHEVLPAAVVAGEQRQRAAQLRARRVGPGALQSIGLRPVAEIDLQRAAHDRLDAGLRQLVGEFERTEQVVGVGQPYRGKALRHRQLGELRDGDGAFQERVGRMHLEVHEMRPCRATRRIWSSSTANRVHGMHAHANLAARKGPPPALAPSACRVASSHARHHLCGPGALGRRTRDQAAPSVLIAKFVSYAAGSGRISRSEGH